MPRFQRSQDPERQEHPRRNIRNRDRQAMRRPIDGSAHAHQPRHRLRHQIELKPRARYGPVCPYPEIDPTIRRGLRARSTSQPKPSLSSTPGRKFSTTISARSTNARNAGTILCRLQIQRDRAFVPVPDHERRALAFHERRHAARIITGPRLLDLDHVGAVIGQHHGAIRSRQMRGQVQHQKSVERPSHVRLRGLLPLPA